MEIHRQINVATRITFPIVDADGDTVTAATALDSESTTWADGSNPGAFVDLTNEATEIGTTGIYYLILTAAEMNFDYIYIRIQTTSAGAKTQHILINTRFAPLVNASGRVDVASVAGTAQTAGDIIARLPAALVGGRIDSSVGAVATGAIAAAAFAAGAIDNAAFNVTETLTANPATGGIVAASFGAGAIDAAAIATGAIDADSIAAAAITAAKFAAGAIDAAALAADAVDEIWDEAMVEQAQGIPGAAPAFRTVLAYLYMTWRNAFTLTSSTKTFSNDAGTVIAKKALTDDGTTYTEAEAVSGP